MIKWYEDEKINECVILSSRIRLARNLADYPFSIKLEADVAKNLISDVCSGIKNYPNSASYNIVDVYNQDINEKLVMLEKHNISMELINKDDPTAVILKDDESTAIMLNEEDHIRIQTIVAGDNIDAAWHKADQIDNWLENSMIYAFHENFGYLTACPTNVGTGMRASFMLHMPLLEMTGQLKNIASALAKFGMVVRGIYGEGSESQGGIYQISNQVTIGKTELENIMSLKNVMLQMVEKETSLREQFSIAPDKKIIDRVYRSYGALSYARVMTDKEAMEHLSNVRLGYMLPNIDLVKPKQPIYQIMMETQIGNLQKNAGRQLNTNERDIIRAEYLRSLFS